MFLNRFYNNESYYLFSIEHKTDLTNFVQCNFDERTLFVAEKFSLYKIRRDFTSHILRC